MALARTGETAYPPFDSARWAKSKSRSGQTKMVKALRRWLEANQLFAIITGVVGGLLLLSMVLVLGGYLLVTR